MNSIATIKELQIATPTYVKAIAALHKKAFPAFFLTQLGTPFLETLYAGYLEDVNSGIVIAECNDKLIGFIAYSNNYSFFFKKLLKNHFFKFAFYSLLAAIQHPSFIKRLLGAFNKSKSVVKKERYVELASICVDPNAEGHGIGSALVEHLKAAVDFTEYAYINLETDASKNDAVNNFYIKNGFCLSRQYVTSEGRKMNEYRFLPGE